MRLCSELLKQNPCLSGYRSLRFHTTKRSISEVSLHRSKKARQRIFLAGVNPFLPPTNRNAISPSFVEVPLSEWLGSLGVQTVDPAGDREGGDIEITNIASGYGHALIGYRHKGTESIFAIGRNESGQLGIGYNSQEPTRGLVEGFSGDFVQSIACGITSTYMQVKKGGQLGMPPALPNSDNPVQKFTPRATIVPLPAQVSVKQLCAGFEHCLILSDEGRLYGTGVNTDGQLGSGDDLDRHRLEELRLPDPLMQEGIAKVEAGADTSAVISREGNLWTFGNSEYAQAFHGQKIDRVMEARLVDRFLIDSAEVTSFKTSGSSSILLSDRGLVYSAGYGAIGQGAPIVDTIKPTRIPGLEGIRTIHSGYGRAMAVNDRDEVYMWGLNTPSGKLGTGSNSNAHHPLRVVLPEGINIENMALGSQTSWIVGLDSAG